MFRFFLRYWGAEVARETDCGQPDRYQTGKDDGSFIQEGKTVLEGQKYEIRQIVEFQFLHQDRAVFFHGLGADVQDLRRGLIGMSLDDNSNSADRTSNCFSSLSNVHR